MDIINKILQTLFLVFVTVIGSAQEIKFAELSIKNIKKASQATHKPYFIYLYSDDCYECKLFEQNINDDLKLSEIISQNILPIKINIDSEQGEKFAKKHKVNLVPAFLFYSMKGKLLLQQETSLSSNAMNKLFAVLYEFSPNVPLDAVVTENKMSSKINETTAKDPLSKKAPNQDLPRKTIVVSANRIPEISDEVRAEASLNRLKTPDQLFNRKPAAIKIEEHRSLKTKVQPALKVNEKPRTTLVRNEPVVREVIYSKEPKEDIFTTSVANFAATSSIVKNKILQFGAYVKYEDVLNNMFSLKKKLESDLTIIEETTNGKKMYKLVSANEMTLVEAKILHASLKNKNIDCFIRKAY